MATVLIATLGESPIVITGMVNVLQARGVALDRVQVIYPDEPNERWIGVGYEQIAAHLRGKWAKLSVEPVPLPFADATTEADSLLFLQTLYSLLETHEKLENTVYLSLAGGRKHLSALMALCTQFFSVIHGLYHLHDTREADARAHFTIEQLDRVTEAERRGILDQPVERFLLVELPYTQLTNARALRQWLARAEQDDAPPPIAINPQAESFYGKLFAPPKPSGQRLVIQLSATAYQQYCDWYNSSSTRLHVVRDYLENMQQAVWVAAHLHDQVEDAQHQQEGTGKALAHFNCKKKRTAERVYFYTQPHPANTPNKELVERVIITRFAYHISKKKYDCELIEWLKEPDIEPRYALRDLPDRPLILIAPLGESPMVITQAYQLLTAQRRDIKTLIVVYPAQHAQAEEAAQLLKAVCRQREVPLQLRPIAIADLDSREAVATFTTKLSTLTNATRTDNPKAEVSLLISGGRKSMSALALYVAQANGIERVWHTTITDPAYEKDLFARVKAAHTRPTSQQASLFFLDGEDLHQFTLIDVPVIGAGNMSMSAERGT